MPTYQKPNTDLRRLSMAEQALARLAQEGEEKKIVQGETAVSLQSTYQLFKNAYESLRTETNLRQAEVEESAEAMAELEMYIRHIWLTIKNRVLRKNLPASIYGYYGLNLASDSPIPTKREEWIQLAKEIIAGDKQAVSAGYDPVAEPTAEELEKVLAVAESSVYEVNIAHDNVREAVQALVDARQPLDEALTDLVADIQYALRKEPAPAVRNAIRSYGGHYRYAQGEEAEAGDIITEG